MSFNLYYYLYSAHGPSFRCRWYMALSYLHVSEATDRIYTPIQQEMAQHPQIHEGRKMGKNKGSVKRVWKIRLISGNFIQGRVQATQGNVGASRIFSQGKTQSSSSRRLPSQQYLQMNIPAFPFTFSINCNSAIGKAETN